MRLFGAQEGFTVGFYFNYRVGEELFFDSCRRHFIAFSLCVWNSRTVSPGEGFELRSHHCGELHVAVMVIGDGMLKCGLLTDASHIRLVVHPASLTWGPSDNFLRGGGCERGIRGA